MRPKPAWPLSTTVSHALPCLPHQAQLLIIYLQPNELGGKQSSYIQQGIRGSHS